MAVALVSTRDMDRQTWLEWRRRGIGGSDAPAVCGVSPWRSPIQVYLEKVGEIVPEDEPGEAAYWGTVLEDIVAREFSRRTGLKVRRRNAILQSPEHPWMIANLDRVVVGENAPLECKTAGEWLRKQWDGDRVPDAYMVQVQHQMAVLGASHAYLAVLIGGNTFRWVRVERDQELIDAVISIEAEFWSRVERRTPPAFDGSRACEDLLKRLYPEAETGKTVRLPVEARDLIQAYLDAKQAEKEAKKRLDEAANRLKALLGDAEVGLLDEWQVSWKNRSRSNLDTEALKRDHPHIHKQYSKTVTYREFSVK